VSLVYKEEKGKAKELLLRKEGISLSLNLLF
jgi:hypothetical protein